MCLNRVMGPTSRKRTAPHDRIPRWKAPAEKCSVGQSRSAIARDTFVLVREGNTCDGGDEGSQDRNEGENPHDVWLTRKKVRRVGAEGSKREREAKRTAWGRKETEILTVL